MMSTISQFLKSKYLLIIICVFFLFTRLYKITDIPVSVYWDEASIGYNAYSVLQTGKDEWGEFLPIHFRAFGEFKLPVYIYATVASVNFFGLNAFAVRLPAVLFSLGVVILTYLLSKRLSGITLGLLSSFFVTISPWFFIFSRTGYEATAGLMFYLLAIYFFLKLSKNTWFILFSALSFILSAYSYNSFRIIVPLTIFFLIIYELKSIKCTLPFVMSLTIILLSVVPIYKLYVYDAGASRLQTVGATNSTFIKNYLSHFSPDFLVLNGDKNLRSQQEGFGQLYLPELILLLLGIIYIAKSRLKYKLLLFTFLLLGPIPAAVTRESPHALRAISMVPFISIFAAFGVAVLWKLVKRERIINLIVIAIFLIFFANYFLNFLNIYPQGSAKEWQYEYKQIYIDFRDSFGKYDRILVSDKYAQPYIFALFYLKYDPDKFRQEVVRNNVDQWGFSTVKKFGKFEFGKFPELFTFEK